MIVDVKNIHLGVLVKHRIKECGMDNDRICKFLKCTDEELEIILSGKTMDSEVILRFSILLGYDFFRIYSQYLLLYAPARNVNVISQKSALPNFRKNLYTKEIIDFILELLNSEKKSKQQIITEYRIPKTTLYKWIKKYGNGF